MKSLAAKILESKQPENVKLNEDSVLDEIESASMDIYHLRDDTEEFFSVYSKLLADCVDNQKDPNDPQFRAKIKVMESNWKKISSRTFQLIKHLKYQLSI